MRTHGDVMTTAGHTLGVLIVFLCFIALGSGVGHAVHLDASPQARPTVKTAAKPAAKAAPAAPVFFATPLTADALKGKQAVVETTRGRIVIELLPEQAPNHVGYFIKLASEGAYNGTIFHRLISGGIIQGGDPLSKDPTKADTYGTGGLGVLKAEPGAGGHVRGAVSAVLVPGKRDSAGAQFFICVAPQPALPPEFNDTVHDRGIPCSIITPPPPGRVHPGPNRSRLTVDFVQSALPIVPARGRGCLLCLG